MLYSPQSEYLYLVAEAFLEGVPTLFEDDRPGRLGIFLINSLTVKGIERPSSAALLALADSSLLLVRTVI
jgi:hypothetical protein